MARYLRSAGLLAVALTMAILAGCSSGGEDQPSATNPTTTSAATPSPTAANPSATAEVEPDFDITEILRRDEVVILNVVPPLDESSDLPLPTGMSDFDRVFSPEGDWEEARQHVDIYRLHAWQLRYVLTDAQIRTMIAYLDEHDIALMFETEPLTYSPSLGCDHSESFSGVYDLEMAQRFLDLGGTFHAVAIEEPYHFVHKLDGPRNCQWPVERIVDEVIEYVADLRELFPDVPVGTIEPIWSSPATTPEDMEIWLDTWEQRAGEPFAFLHIDPDWYHPAWPEVALGIEAVADARSVPFGLLYNGGQEPDSESWMQFTMENVELFEQQYGGTPQHVSFQSWVDLPDRALPPDDLGAITSGIVRYFGERTTLALSDTTAQAGAELTARLTTVEGAPVTDADVAARIRSSTGALGTRTMTGTVPDGVSEAVVVIRVNTEGAEPGPAHARIASVSYREAGGPELIGNGDFGAGTSEWAIYGPTPSIVGLSGDGGENWLAIDAGPDEQVLIDGTLFTVTPGADYQFVVRFGIDGASSEAIQLGVEFLDSERAQLDMSPPTTDLATVRTDAAGYLRLPIGGLEPGSYQLELDYAGDLSHWPTETSLTIDISQ